MKLPSPRRKPKMFKCPYAGCKKEFMTLQKLQDHGVNCSYRPNK